MASRHRVSFFRVEFESGSIESLRRGSFVQFPRRVTRCRGDDRKPHRLDDIVVRRDTVMPHDPAAKALMDEHLLS